MSVKHKATASAEHIEGQAGKAKGTDPEAEVGIDAVGMGSFDPFQILSGIVLNLIEQYVPPVKECLDAVTVNEGAARQQAEFWNSTMTSDLMDQHHEMATVASGVAANWTTSGDDTMASVEFLARHMALQELIRAVCKGCEGVGWLIGKATDLMVKVRDQIKQWISELFAKIMERAVMALATSWIPVVDAATTAEFIIESAIRIANFIQEAYSLFTKVKNALDTARQVLGELKDGIDQIHDILGAMGVDVPALTTLSKTVGAIAEPIGKVADFADQVDEKIAPVADAVGEAAGAVSQLKGHKPDIKGPHGGHEEGGHQEGAGQPHSGTQGQGHTPMHGPSGGHGGNGSGGEGHTSTAGGSGGSQPAGVSPWHPEAKKPQPGDSTWKQGPGGGYKGTEAGKSLPLVDGKKVNPHHFAAMANQGKSDHGSSTGAQHGGAGAQHGGAGAQHSGAGAQHGGAALSGGSTGSTGAVAGGTHAMGAAPVADKPQAGTSAGPQTVREHGGSGSHQGGQPQGAPAGGQSGQGSHSGQHPGAGSSGSGSSSGTGAGTTGSREHGSGGTRTPNLPSSGSGAVEHGKPSHTEPKVTSGSGAAEHGKPSHTEPKATSGTNPSGGHHDEKQPHTEPKQTEAKSETKLGGAHHDDKHGTAGNQQSAAHHDDKHATAGNQQSAAHHDDKHGTAGNQQSAAHHDDKHGTAGQQQSAAHHDDKHATSHAPADEDDHDGGSHGPNGTDGHHQQTLRDQAALHHHEYEEFIDHQAQQHGVTRDHLNEITRHNYDDPDLSVHDAKVSNEIRNAMPHPGDNAIYQKALDEGRMRSMLSSGPTSQYPSNEIGGFVTHAPDSTGLNTPEKIYHGLALDYKGTTFSPHAKEAYVVNFRLEDGAGPVKTPDGMFNTHLHGDTPYAGVHDKTLADRGVNSGYGPPCTNTGWTRTSTLPGSEPIPEYQIPDSSTMKSGAEIWALGANGSQRIHAVLGADGKWHQV